MSSYGVMRGLHFQRPPFTQSKLVRCVKGRVIIIPSFKRAALGNLKASFHCTHWHRFFPLKTYPSFLTVKEGSTFLTKPLFPQEREDVTALRCSEPLRSKVGGASKPSPWLCGMGPPGKRWGIGWVLPCSKAWWQRMVIELGLSSGYLMAGLLFPAKFIAERIFG